MSQDAGPSEFKTTSNDSSAIVRHRKDIMSRIFTMYAGVILIVVGVFVSMGIYKYAADNDVSKFTSSQFISIIAAVMVVAFFVLSGARLIIKDSDIERAAIPSEDRDLLEDLIKSGNEKGIDQYVRLSSLSGATGTATKLGLSGLPLLTVALTVFFSIVAMFGVDGFMDLTKLTLGAFIGSFVQRNVSVEAAGTRRKSGLFLGPGRPIKR